MSKFNPEYERADAEFWDDFVPDYYGGEPMTDEELEAMNERLNELDDTTAFGRRGRR
jgi:hypothetical protein